MSNLWHSVIVVLSPRCAVFLGLQGSRRRPSVKGLGQQAWIVCSGCCLPAVADFPILLWCWIKYDYAGEEPWGRGAQVTRPAEGPGEAYVVNLSLMETLTLLSLSPTVLTPNSSTSTHKLLLRFPLISSSLLPSAMWTCTLHEAARHCIHLLTLPKAVVASLHRYRGRKFCIFSQ